MTPSVSIPNITEQCLPTEHRTQNFVIMAEALNSATDRLNELFQMYQDGSTDTGYWDVLTTYAKYELVRMLDGVYESRADANLANPVTDTTYWEKVLPSFIGANERSKYTGNYLTLTWALNRIFGTLFRQPPYPAPYDFGLGIGTFSEIYLTNDIPIYTEFVMYPTDALSSDMYPWGSASWFMFDPPVYAIATTYRFVINMPLAVFNALGANDAIRESVVRKFADQLVPSGIGYRIVTY